MIVDPLTLAAFLPAALALNMTPGADMMFCLAQGLRGNRRAAVAASAGISAGSMVNVTLAGLGLGALVAASPHLFSTIRWIGVAYLVWLAIRTLRSPHEVGATGQTMKSPARAFREGFLVNVSNPKVILFILAFIPQFVDPTRGSVLGQFLIFGAVISLGGFFINAAVGWFAVGFGGVLARSQRAERLLRYLSASVFGLLALKLATERRA
ncbi:threonine/homoserine/homoserine lactone efflux protein [Celeribacter persicus]|uniref:Threonine/homoserine/homoserine lactone efflux protein n=1 Tax=Celeribacter persicus TaxID=1651082 RepID=A0A2T5HPH6_9RHOB|nr:threonine/homoserine/homoserine lactone efflux protein [Celeribacter persicus]